MGEGKPMKRIDQVRAAEAAVLDAIVCLNQGDNDYALEIVEETSRRLTSADVFSWFYRMAENLAIL